MRTRWISALAIAILCGWQAMAQTSAGVTGTVTDSSGALVPGAMVSVTNLDNGARRETKKFDGVLENDEWKLLGRSDVRHGVELLLTPASECLLCSQCPGRNCRYVRMGWRDLPIRGGALAM